MSPAQVEMDTRALRDALSVLGDRLGAGVLVVARGGSIVFSTPRATRILGNTISPTVPREITALTSRVEVSDSGGELASVTLPGTPHRIAAQATRLRGSSRYVLVTLTEEAPRATLTSSLVSRFGLSAREVQLVQLASRGLKNREIGERMRLSEATVKTYLHGIFRELGVRNRAELVALADRLAQDPPPAQSFAVGGAF
jgi:DNA-binding CsgD family transcriptional regulator